MVKFDKDKAYMEVLCKFRKLIDSEYKDGGWLPPVREMSKRFNVSPGTYRKASNCLISESMAESYPRKGIYIIPEKFRIKKIGIVLQDGKESPFVIHPSLFASIIDKLYSKGYDIHIIQGRPVSNVVRSAVSHYVLGMIWFLPNREAFQSLEDICNNKIMPTLAVNVQPSRVDLEVLSMNVPQILVDDNIRKARMVDFLVKREHKKIAYVGTKTDADITGLSQKMYDHGLEFNENFCTGLLPDPEEVKDMILDNDITAIIVEGQSRRIDLIFQGLALLSDDKQPEVLSRQDFTTQEIIDNYPNVNLIALSSDGHLSQWADIIVDRFLKNLNDPENMQSAYIDTFKIEEV